MTFNGRLPGTVGAMLAIRNRNAYGCGVKDNQPPPMSPLSAPNLPLPSPLTPYKENLQNTDIATLNKKLI